MKPYMEEAARLIRAYYFENIENASDGFSEDIMASASFDDTSTQRTLLKRCLVSAMQLFVRKQVTF